jgi:26S proteasome regulatory subunit T2
MGSDIGGNRKPKKDEKDKDEEKKISKKPDVMNMQLGKKRKKKKGVDIASKLPTITPNTKCLLRLRKYERIKDYLLMEKEYIQNKKGNIKEDENAEEEKNLIETLRGTPIHIGTLEEMINEEKAIVSLSGEEFYVNILSIVDKEQLELGCNVLLRDNTHHVVGILADEADPLLNVMKVDKAPTETYGDVGGLEQQIREIKEAVELPLTHPELYEEIGIKPPKGVILYGEPGTGKTLLAKAVANETSATFFRVVGSELVQKYSGEGPKLVRELFRLANEHAPSIVFIDEIDSIGHKRIETSSGGHREVQRTMLELLNQLDGFDTNNEVKVILATNKIESLDPALIRPGRIDRKIHFPFPDIDTKRRIFQIHTSKMNLDEDVNLEEFILSKDELSGADIKAITTEAGLLALRDRRKTVSQQDFRKAKEKVLYKKKGMITESLYI